MEVVAQKIQPELETRFSAHPKTIQETLHFIHTLGSAPVYILAFQDRYNYNAVPTTIIQSVAAAIQNMLLAAWELGIGSCWLTAPIVAGMSNELRQTFAPDKGELMALITLGYPEKIPNAPKRRENRYVIR